ncbi:MAG: capsule biosynthesis protein [Alphaproteobacteria bacterium]
MTKRRFLFLQGNSCYFFSHLGRALRDCGHGVMRINQCGGDRAFWPVGDATTDFRGRLSEFGAFVGEFIDANRITDLILYNDCRPAHRMAIKASRHSGVVVHIFEEGYLRPAWITLERGGLNGYTRLPDDPNWYRARARSLPPFRAPWFGEYGMKNRVLYDFRWQIGNYFWFFRYPHYRTHRPYPIWVEYASWLTRLYKMRRGGEEADQIVADLAASGRSYVLFPLQLDTDSQVRIHSPFGRLVPAIRAVISDFARNAPLDMTLVIKNHPLDNGLVAFQRAAEQQAADLGVADRVIYIDGGDLDMLIGHARGVVNINSTVGLSALCAGAPVIALGKAVYDIAGLTHHGPLATFWGDPARPDEALLKDFLAVLADCAMIPGSFYTEDGASVAADHALKRILSAEDPLEGFHPGHRRFVSRIHGWDVVSDAV